MTLLSLRGIVKAFGGRQILRGVDLQLPDGARIGLVGPNGSGKSTLLRIAVGDEESDAGQITRQRGLRLAMLAQHPLGDERTPATTLQDARADLREIDDGLADCDRRLADPSVYNDGTRMEAVLAEQARLLDRYDRAGGPSFEGRVRSMLAEIGLEERELELPTRVLSGGQRKLIGLAAAIIQDPQLLLLDEPEAHLDLEGRERLQALMTRFGGGILAVSHDRYLLDETVTDIASLDGGQVRVWPGNYTSYAIERELELRRQQANYMAQRKEIDRLEEASRRLIQWARSVPASQSNKGLMNAARNLQRRVERMDKVERPVLERRRIGLELHPHQRGGKRAAELREVGMDFGDNRVLQAIELTVMHGERVGVVGELAPTAGEVWVGPSIRIGYLAQDQDTLDPDSTPLATLRATFPGTEEQAVARLMTFLFDYEQVRRPIRTLSGGERTRLQLMLLMLSGANLLVLDEPTNHLDIESIETLEAAIEAFEGTAIFISHDRYFLDRMADRVVEVRDGAAQSWNGGYSDWLLRRTEMATPLAAGGSIRE
ncbi:MAG TPA: ABC-F family ATP-binding cassette domain-containing protein [Candidatus Limnocylindria bacterium]|nr:ABC-F family ATP-binding cassette domain-containing protein [Candidatus Limnocylindria bacterium]